MAKKSPAPRRKKASKKTARKAAPAASATPAASGPAQVGAPAPAFTLHDQQGRAVTLADLLSHGGPLVLYFYPEALSPSCTTQACDFRDAAKALAKLNARVVGISPDQPDRLARFDAKERLGFTLLSDAPAQPGAVPPTTRAFGLWVEKSMYGKTYLGLARTTLVLDAGGVVRARFDRVRVPGHVERVIDALRALA